LFFTSPPHDRGASKQQRFMELQQYIYIYSLSQLAWPCAYYMIRGTCLPRKMPTRRDVSKKLKIIIE